MPGKSLASPLLVIAQMEFAPPSGADRPSFDGKTLLLPGVGIGNVGQLAIELLVVDVDLLPVIAQENTNL